MWAVAKIKIKNLNTFKKELAEKVGNDIKFYYPKIEYFKYFGKKVKRFEKYMLENYIFCYHVKFKKTTFCCVIGEKNYLCFTYKIYKINISYTA